MPEIGLSKSFNLLSDPVNGSTEPKMIPGAIIEYDLAVSNQGLGAADSDTVITTNAVPVETALFVGDIAGAGSGPVQFIDGSIASGLTFNFNSLNSTTDSVSFSNDNGASYTYIPTPDGAGCDGSVTHLRIALAGIFNASNGTDHPSFIVRYRVRVD